jgi:protein SCO1
MRDRSTRAFSRIVAGCALAGLACMASAQYRPTAQYFPNVELQTHEGATVRFYDDLLKGKAVAINTVYTSCSNECPLETARLAEVQRLLGERVGRDVQFYSISIEPQFDTPAVLKGYAQKFGVGKGWTFLTGKPADVELVTRRLGLARNADRGSKDGHAPVLMLGIEPTGQWMRHSAVDSPRFLAATMGSFFGWRDDGLTASYAKARAIDAGTGELLFASRCAACHSVGGGERIGPDLLGVTARRDRAWLERFIAAPDTVLAEKDPLALALLNEYGGVRMPNLRLTSSDVTAVLGYLETKNERRSEAAARSSGATR